ncbi:hypothetical protein CMEL01_11631 [Colletotrichum melonis]|uniref:Uncharacterized protein n=1 Tax=Colletotrichum melonis TaxID=1209925 RepID=A0AAI9XVQ8_9PEZI|nr:hypothetical protein CMEL01_11631 [Colletotrichum melonis]
MAALGCCHRAYKPARPTQKRSRRSKGRRKRRHWPLETTEYNQGPGARGLGVAKRSIRQGSAWVPCSPQLHTAPTHPNSVGTVRLLFGYGVRSTA